LLLTIYYQNIKTIAIIADTKFKSFYLICSMTFSSFAHPLITQHIKLLIDIVIDAGAPALNSLSCSSKSKHLESN